MGLDEKKDAYFEELIGSFTKANTCKCFSTVNNKL